MGRISACIVLALAIGGCDDEPHRGYDSDISFPEAQALMERGPRRLDLVLTPEGASSLAHLVEVEEDDELLDDEQIEADLVGFAELEMRGACRGVLALDVPGVQVRFDSAVTRFGGLEDAPGCTAFVENVTERLDEGGAVRVEARRRPPPAPQDPDDASFFAEALLFVGDEGGSPAALELNVAPANLKPCALLAERPSDCSGALTILGADVVARDGLTEVAAEDPTELLIFDVEDRVVSVDANANALILEDGTPLRIVDGTRFDGELRLGDVEESLASGGAMQVEGDAVLSASAPTSLLGIELALHPIEVEEDDVEPGTIALTGRVMAVEPRLGVVLLPFDTDVIVDAMTILDGDFTDLEDLDRFVDAGAPVRAEVLGSVEPLEPQRVIRADRLTLRRAGQAM